MTEKDLEIAIEKCERIMEFDTRTLENPESENGHIFEKIYDLLQFLRQLQSATDTNVGGNLIDRQAALDAIKKLEKPAPTAQHLSAIFDCEDTIKALPSAQPVVISKSENATECEDAVSRTEAVEALYDWEQMYTWDEHCKEDGGESPYIVSPSSIIEKLPPVTPKQPGWIPVTERLPRPNEYENDVRAYYLVQNEYGDMMVCSWDGRCWMQMYRHTHVEDKVVAWMPLPKPWKGEKDDG